jgi:flagella basal body P-ring formation protein FlgA
MTVLVQVLLVGALTIVGNDTRSVKESEIKEVVKNLVASRFEDSDTRYAIEFRNMPTKVLNVPRSATLQVAGGLDAEMRGIVLVPIEVFANGRVEHTFLVTIKVRTFEQVLMASDKIEKHEDAEDIAATEELIETTGLAAEPVKSYAALSGKRAKHIVMKGAVLTENMFERIPLVNQGSTVTLIMRSNNVVIKATGIAREDGSPGDVVLVQKEGSGDKLKARVVDAHTVEVLAKNE